MKKIAIAFPISSTKLPDLQPPYDSHRQQHRAGQAGEFDRAAERARWDVQPDEFMIGYFGFLNLSKGGADLMQALKTLLDEGLSG